jgi:hypothetical protein
MQQLHSISQIQTVYETGQKPVLVECNDLRNYVCKHNQGNRPAHALFTEWIVYHLLSVWNVSLAPLALVDVNEIHVPASTVCQPAFFRDLTCFATLQLEEATEWNQFQFPLPKQEMNKITNRIDLLKIAFIDCWCANEDRNWNNFNLLLKPHSSGYSIIPIDHELCFNSRGFNTGRALYSIDFSDSIASTDIFRTVIGRTLKSLADANHFIKEFYLCIHHFKNTFDQKALEIPGNWKIPSVYIDQLRENLFDPEWLNETKTLYLSFLKSGLKLK